MNYWIRGQKVESCLEKMEATRKFRQRPHLLLLNRLDKLKGKIPISAKDRGGGGNEKRREKDHDSGEGPPYSEEPFGALREERQKNS